jgi:lauroyl/myristoyl acyltransferase
VAGLWRTPENNYAGRAMPALRFRPTSDRDSDVNAAMQRIMGHVEGVIRAHPDQWYMFRRMWPDRPAVQPETGLTAIPAGA